MGFPRWTVAILLALAVPAAIPGAAKADDVTINFDDLTAGTSVTNQFVDFGGAGTGLEFGKAPFGSDGVIPTVETVAASEAQSGDHVADIHEAVMGISRTYTWGHFKSPRSFVRAYVGFTGVVIAPPTITLTAYESNGTTLGSKNVTPSVADSYKTKLEFTYPWPSISYFKIAADNDCCADTPEVKIDDLAYDKLGDKDFSLALDQDYFENGALSVKPGKSVGFVVNVNRENGSNGPLSYSAQDLPAGVDIYFVDDPANNPTQVTGVLTASKSAKLFSGKFKVVATPTGDESSPGKAPRSVDVPLQILESFDARVNGIEVTQGIQPVPAGKNTIQGRDPGNPFAAVAYDGVVLDHLTNTVARVYANLGAPVDGKVKNITALLYGYGKNGKQLKGSPLAPEPGSTVLKYGSPNVSYADRAQWLKSYAFTLPITWSQGTIKLKAKIFPPPASKNAPDECTTETCKQNNSFTMKSITFTDNGFVRPGFVALPANSEKLPSPEDAIDDAETLAPTSLIYDWYTYLMTFDISTITNATTLGSLYSKCSEALPQAVCDVKLDGDFKNSYVLAKLKALELVLPTCKKSYFDYSGCIDIIFGINTKAARGITSGNLLGNTTPVAVGKLNRPLTSIAHEMGHTFARPHASKACGGGSKGQTGEDWPPDEQGYIQGVGLDPRPFSGSGFAKYQPIVPQSLSGIGGTDDTKPGFIPSQYYDFMSYCTQYTAPDRDSWISPKGWKDAFTNIFAYSVLRNRATSMNASSAATGKPRSARLEGAAAGPSAGTAANKGQLAVQAMLVDDLPPIFTAVGPADAYSAESEEASPYMLVARDAGGNVIGTSPMGQDFVHVDEGDPSYLLAGSVPAKSARRVEIYRDGALAGAIDASANAPRLRILSPRVGQRVAGRKAKIRWRASDADGDELTARVEYSANGGRRWRALWAGPNKNRAAVPGRLLSASRRARIRVRVNDGFLETAKMTGSFTTAGGGPAVHIDAGRKTKVRSDSQLTVTGSAYDDTGEAIRPARLRWLLDGRAVGRGTGVTLDNLRPGSRKLRLVATDRHGRKGVASATVRVAGKQPTFLMVDGPDKLGSGKRSVTLRVAALGAKRLEIRGHGVRKRAAVDTNPRRIHVRVKPGRADLKLRLKLVGYGGTRNASLAIGRNS